MFYHAYNNYLENAYPYDELRPLTCDGQDTWGRYTAETFVFFNNKEKQKQKDSTQPQRSLTV